MQCVVSLDMALCGLHPLSCSWYWLMLGSNGLVSHPVGINDSLLLITTETGYIIWIWIDPITLITYSFMAWTEFNLLTPVFSSIWHEKGQAIIVYSSIIFRCRIRNLSIFIQREPLVSEECGRRAFLSLVTVSYQVQPQIHQMIKQSWLATRFAFYQDIWKRFIKFLEKMFSLFAGGSLGAMNGLYRYRKELLLRAAEGMSSPCKILWNEMLQIRLTVYPSLYIFVFEKWE